MQGKKYKKALPVCLVVLSVLFARLLYSVFVLHNYDPLTCKSGEAVQEDASFDAKAEIAASEVCFYITSLQYDICDIYCLSKKPVPHICNIKISGDEPLDENIYDFIADKNSYKIVKCYTQKIEKKRYMYLLELYKLSRLFYKEHKSDTSGNNTNFCASTKNSDNLYTWQYVYDGTVYYKNGVLDEHTESRSRYIGQIAFDLMMNSHAVPPFAMDHEDRFIKGWIEKHEGK